MSSPSISSSPPPPRTSSSPQWDSRNRGFITPTQLQQLRQSSPGLHEFPPHQPSSGLQGPSNSHSSLPATSDPSMNLGSSPQARPPLATSNHTRTSSFFGGFRSKISSSSTSDQPPQRAASLARPNAAAALAVRSAGSQHSPPHQAPTQQGSPQQPVQQQLQTASQQHPQHQQQQQQLQGPQMNRQPTAQAEAPAPMHPEIRSVVQLTIAHAHKVYFSGPLIRRIERQADGQRPSKDDGWTDVWAQLGGTTLSIWDMKQIEEASKQGKEVPPTYVNMTDAFISVLGSVTIPSPGNGPPKRYTNVITLNTAGSNLLLFACPSSAAIISWAAALRLSAWEKSRLEEIYSAHLIRITFNARDIPTTLVRGRMEGWVRIRVAGQTDWKRMWMVLGNASDPLATATVAGRPTSPNNALLRKKRMSSLFSRDHSPPSPPSPGKAMIHLYTSPKAKDRKHPLLTMSNVTQAFAVYPERPELISKSTLLKVEGLLGDEEIAAAMRCREAWLLIMPELEGGNNQSAEMLKWVIGLHDAFELYGRPQAWTWDPREPTSMMFGYPVGPHKDLLFLDREFAETLDPRDDRTSAVRSHLRNILLERMRNTEQPPPQRTSSDAPPSLPPINLSQSESGRGQPPQQNGSSAPQLQSGPQLPPLSFDSQPQSNNISDSRIQQRDKSLTPITEVGSVDHSVATRLSLQSASGPSIGPEFQHESITNRVLTTSPQPDIPLLPEKDNTDVLRNNSHAPGKLSNDSSGIAVGSAKTDSIFNSSTGNGAPRTSQDSFSARANSASVPQPVSPKSFVSPRSQTTDTVSPRRTSPPSSILTSPHSVHDYHQQSPAPSILTSPHSPLEANHPPISMVTESSNFRRAAGVPGSPPAASVVTNPTRPAPEETQNFSNEAGALYYMKEFETERGHPPAVSEDDDDSTSDSDVKPMKNAIAGPSSPPERKSPPARRGTPMAFERIPPDASSHPDPEQIGPTHLGRKPTGARAPSANRLYADDSLPSQREDESDPESLNDEPHPQQRVKSNSTNMQAERSSSEDPNADALAALSYLDVEDERVPPSVTTTVEPLRPKKPDANPSPPPLLPTADQGPQYRSSFAPSKHAAERKAKAQAQQAAHDAAVHKPGRANGKRKSKVVDRGAWNESSEDEEEEEEEEEEDGDSDAEPSAPRQSSTPSSGPTSSNPSLRPSQQQGPGSYFAGTTPDVGGHSSHSRPPRTLPQIPGNRPPQDSDDHHGYAPPPPRRMAPDQYSEAGRRTYFDDGPQIRSQAEFPNPGAARQTVWSQVLDPGHTPGAVPEQTNGRDTFVQLESSAQMTKAFTPQGLLSAGLQDKQDRSAKRQEELARESGASLINVPGKPPPPQTGLLGAITAHERDRKREGGVGAALTEREREKRLAEERQRRFDDHQRQQLDQMQQGGSMYGGQQFPGYNPMMANPMMMGMNPMMGMAPMMTGGPVNPMMTGGQINPMMTGQMGGFPGMIPGYNPQHMFAAQQAAQAYQQAMMAFSVAGSQAGGDGGTPPLNPMMAGANMTGFDPRMSMMGMPMMGSPAMGPPMGQSMMGMPMQMTGMSAFDPRFPPSMNASPMNDPGLLPPGGFGGQAQYPSRNSSPVSRGSPLARSSENLEHSRQSRPISPKR